MTLIDNPDARYDVIIIGGGPAGLTAALYAARARLRTLVLDRSPAGGALARQSHLQNFPGVPEPTSGPDMLNRVRDQAVGFGAEYVHAAVSTVDLSGEVKQVYTLQGGSYEGRSVIIATGAMGWRRALPGVAELLGHGVSFCATCDAPLYQGKDVAVLGDSQEAFEEALHIAEFATTVYLLTPSDRLWASDDTIAQAKSHPHVRLQIATKPTAILGDQQVEGLQVRHKGGGEEVLPVHGVFIYLQDAEPITDFLGGTLATSDSKCLLVDPLMHTSIEGVFAAGDVVCNRLRQVVIACGQGATAAIEATRYVAEQKRKQ